MKTLSKGIVGLLVLSMVGLSLPDYSFCEGKDLYDKASKKNITRHAPVMKSTPEEDITSEMAGGGGKKSKWLWIGLGVAVVGGLVAVASSSGSSGDGDSGTSANSSDNGSISVGW